MNFKKVVHNFKLLALKISFFFSCYALSNYVVIQGSKVIKRRDYKLLSRKYEFYDPGNEEWALKNKLKTQRLQRQEWTKT